VAAESLMELIWLETRIDPSPAWSLSRPGRRNSTSRESETTLLESRSKNYGCVSESESLDGITVARREIPRVRRSQIGSPCVVVPSAGTAMAPATMPSSVVHYVRIDEPERGQGDEELQHPLQLPYKRHVAELCALICVLGHIDSNPLE